VFQKGVLEFFPLAFIHHFQQAFGCHVQPVLHRVHVPVGGCTTPVPQGVLVPGGRTPTISHRLGFLAGIFGVRFDPAAVSLGSWVPTWPVLAGVATPFTVVLAFAGHLGISVCFTYLTGHPAASDRGRNPDLWCFGEKLQSGGLGVGAASSTYQHPTAGGHYKGISSG
jgi:hypothetical protein